MEIFIAILVIFVVLIAAKVTKNGLKPWYYQLLDQPEKLHRWPEDGIYSQPVVGESNYQEALRSIWDKCSEVGTDAILLHEDKNKHDNKAVAIFVDKNLVGYLSRDDARKFRRRCARNHVGAASICKARVSGKEGKQGMIGIWLDL
jgi:hypothetical protein